MRKYFNTIIILIILPLILQVLIADNISLKWTHFRWYLFAALSSSYVLSRFRFTKKLISNFFTMLLIMGTSVAFIYKFIKNAQINGEFLWDEMTMAICCASIFYIIIFAVRRLEINVPKIFSSIELIVLLPYITNLAYAFIEYDCITADSLIAIYQTNIFEICEFLRSTAPFYVYLIIIVVLCLVMNFFIKTLDSLKVKSNVTSVKEAIFVILTFSLVAFILNKTFNDTYFNRIINDSQQYLNSVKHYNSYRFNTDGSLKFIKAKNNDLDGTTYVVIIGESQNRKHMSAYGYSRETTPWLQKQLTNNNFVFMKNGYACNTLTMLALSQALTEKSQYNHKSLDESYSLIDVAKAAGFKTYWISNQAQYGSFNTPVTLIANSADKKIWLNSDSSASSSYDEKILPALSEIKDKDKKIIFIHLYGNHWEYNHRYPKDKYSQFTHKEFNGQAVNLEKLNDYDNSIFYNDYIIKKIFEYARKNWNANSIVYFSDHGEAVRSNNKHIPSKYEDDMGTIPVYFYFSDEYIKAHPSLVYDIRKKKETYFTNDMMYNVLLDLWGISTPYYNSREDFLSDNYGYGVGKLLILDKIKI